jgi:formamidopyrimidine-DNA glycosylase
VPELPEVETVRRDLEALATGRRVTGVEATGARSIRRTSAATLAAAVEGRTIMGAERRGKYLFCRLDGDVLVVVHLRMSGQLRWTPAGQPRMAHTHVVLHLDGGHELRFVDPRTFGEVFTTTPDRLAADAPGIARLGWDPLLDPLPRARFSALVTGRRRQLKALLCDQGVVAGLGNIYSDEVLHAARLRFDRTSATLTPREVGRLYRAIPEVLVAAIEARGSSLADAQYVDLLGRPGSFQHQHQVHARAGQPCPRCGRLVIRVRYQGRSTYFCPGCQR